MGNTGRSVMCKQGHGRVSGSRSVTLWACKCVSAALASRWHVEKFCLRQQAAARKCDKSNKMYGSKTHPNKKHAHIWWLFFSSYGGGLYQVRGTENNCVYGLTWFILCSSLQLLCQGCSCAPSAFFFSYSRCLCHSLLVYESQQIERTEGLQAKWSSGWMKWRNT